MGNKANKAPKSSDGDDASKYPIAHHVTSPRHDVSTNRAPPRRTPSRRRHTKRTPKKHTPTGAHQQDEAPNKGAIDRNKQQSTKPSPVFDSPQQIPFRPLKLQRDTRVFNPFVTEIHEPKAAPPIHDKKSNDVPSINAPHIASFEFGELFGYWDSESPTAMYVAPRYKSLKDEITNPKNEVYIATQIFETDFKPKAIQLRHEMYNDKNTDIDSECAIYAKHKPYFNKLFQIKSGAKMSVEHILSVVLYTDTNELQKYFKQQTRKMHYNEDLEAVAARNRKYAHWFRLLFEVIWLFGDELKYDQKVYHGISCKLLFNKFQYNFNAPLSTTCDETVAMSFCKDKGIVLELRNAESHPQPYFPVQRFSRYSESEYLFFGATLKISSILIPDAKEARYVPCSKEIDVLNFYMNLITGSDIERYSSTHSKNDAKHVHKLGVLCVITLRLIDKHMALLRGEDKSDLTDYIWNLFINFTRTNNIIWINKNELRYLKNAIEAKNNANAALVKTLVDVGADGTGTNGEYLRCLLSHNPALRVQYAVEYQWVVGKDELHRLMNGMIASKDGLVCKDYWDYYINGHKSNMCTFGANMVVGFHDEDSKENAMKKVGFYWRLSDAPAHYKSVMVSLEIYCAQIEFYIQFFNIKMSRSKESKDGVQSTGHTDLFALSELDGLDTFTWRVIMKCWPVAT